MPAASPRTPGVARRALVALLTGLGLVGTSWAGVVLAPAAPDVAAPAAEATAVPAVAADAAGALPAPAPEAQAAVAGLRADDAPAATPPDLSGLRKLPAGQFLVGADERSVAPDPERWQTEGCSEYASNFPEEVDHLAGEITEDMVAPGWPKSPDCVYLGGYGIGPARAATGVDPTIDYRVQTVAISDGEDVLVWQMTPFVGFFNRYRSDLCDACGILDVRSAVAEGLGQPVAHVAVGSNHSHGGVDGYGAWGGMPDWYRAQIRDTLIAAAFDAVRALRPAALEVGSTEARPFSRERRSTYHSVADVGATWLRAVKLDDPDGGRGATIATLVNYAAHPTTLGSSNRLLHGDWPSAASESLARDLGGVGLVFEGGLGNVVPSRPRNPQGDLTGDGDIDDYDETLQMGDDFAAFVGRSIRAGGHRLQSNDIRAVDTTITHPVTNWTETALGLVNLLDREFLPGTPGADGPSSYTWNKGGTGTARPCASAGPVSIKTQLSGYRVGELTVLTAPGEIFSSISLVARQKVRDFAFEGGQTMVFGQTQDSLGYIIPSAEQYPYGGISAGTGGIEYEETFLLDRCFGDHVLQTMLDLGAGLREAS